MNFPDTYYEEVYLHIVGDKKEWINGQIVSAHWDLWLNREEPGVQQQWPGAKVILYKLDSS